MAKTYKQKLIEVSELISELQILNKDIVGISFSSLTARIQLKHEALQIIFQKLRLPASGSRLTRTIEEPFILNSKPEASNLSDAFLVMKKDVISGIE